METTGNLATSASEDKSKFVTVVAWIFIIITGWTTFLSLLQNIMNNVIFSANRIKEAFNDPRTADNIPAVVQFMLTHIQLLFLCFFMVSAAMFTSSIGLLKRKNWARLIFISILALAIIWNLITLFLQGEMIPKKPFIDMPQEGAQAFQMVMVAARIFMAIMVIGMSALFGWIIKKLTSENVKREFDHSKEMI